MHFFLNLNRNIYKLKQAGDKDQKTNADLLQMQLDLEKQKIALQQKEADLKRQMLICSHVKQKFLNSINY